MIGNNFKVLIVDDEPEARTLLRSLLSEIKNVSVVGEAGNSESALYLLVEHYPDLIFMDINMPGKSGMDLVNLIKNRNVDIPVVFISAHKEYAISAIRNQVYDFLLKPVSKDDLKNIIEKHQRLVKKDLPARLMEVLNSIKEETKIRINSKNGYVLINPAEIVYCSFEKGSVKIYLNDGKIENVNTTLNSIIKKINLPDFHLLGRQALLNYKYIRNIDKQSDTCTLKFKQNIWNVPGSHKSIIKLLKEIYSYA